MTIERALRLLRDNWQWLSVLVYATVFLMNERSKVFSRLDTIEARIDAINTTATNCVQQEISKLRADVWTVGMQELWALWVMRHNPSNNVPSPFATQREAQRRLPDVDKIPRLVPPVP